MEIEEGAETFLCPKREKGELLDSATKHDVVDPKLVVGQTGTPSVEFPPRGRFSVEHAIKLVLQIGGRLAYVDLENDRFVLVLARHQAWTGGHRDDQACDQDGSQGPQFGVMAKEKNEKAFHVICLTWGGMRN